jgi:glycosyltransferase involved in cell wall biosynthesis
VARYLRSLLAALAAAGPDDDYAVLVAGRRDPPPFDAPNVRLVRNRAPGRLLFGAAALAGRPALDRLAGGCDLAWIPAPAPVAVSRDVPVVLTLHDLSFEHRPRDFGAYERLWHRLARPRRLARGAGRVLCVSKTVRDAAVAEWGLDPARVRVVASGPGRPPGAAGALPAGLPERFVLAVGALEPRKRPGLLAEAHRRARSRGLRAGLVYAGDGPLRGELDRTGATVLGHVSDPVLEALHARALALACVSREEGFGFTPLEAAARGTPAVVADLPVFEDTLGDAALRVPPGDPDALAGALLRLEREPELRERIAAAGRAAVGRLSWDRAARETRAAFAEVAG